MTHQTYLPMWNWRYAATLHCKKNPTMPFSQHVHSWTLNNDEDMEILFGCYWLFHWFTQHPLFSTQTVSRFYQDSTRPGKGKDWVSNSYTASKLTLLGKCGRTNASCFEIEVGPKQNRTWNLNKHIFELLMHLILIDLMYEILNHEEIRSSRQLM